MKYSTLRSKTWPPLRCSRIARFVSGVIQFSRPISSSGAPGALRDLQPVLVDDRLRDELVILDGHAHSNLLLGRDAAGSPRRERRRDRVGGGRTGASRTPRGRGRSTCRAPARGRRRRRAAPRSSRRSPPGGAGRVDDLAAAAELGRPLLAHAVRDEQIDAVLERARSREQLGVGRRRERPVRRQADDLRARERERPGHLREAQVVADLESDPADRRVEDRQLVARRARSGRRRGTAGGSCDRSRRARPGRRARPRCGSTSPSRSSRPQTTCASRRRHASSRTAVDGPGISSAIRQRLVGALVHVAGDRALGQDEQLGARSDRLLEACRDRGRDSAPSRPASARSGLPLPASAPGV